MDMTTMTPIAARPKHVTIATQGKWTGDVRTAIQIRHFDPVIMDEPVQLGGTDRGPNPMEYLLAALMGCETVLMAIVAKERDFTYEDIEYDLAGTLDLRGLEGVEGVRPYFNKITGTIKVVTNEDPETLMDVAKEVERRCPVYTTLEAADVAFDVDWVAIRP